MTEYLGYRVVRSEGNIEVRDYPGIVLVSVSGLSDNEAFGVLFNYISGKNVPRRRIPMTAP